MKDEWDYECGINEDLVNDLNREELASATTWRGPCKSKLTIVNLRQSFKRIIAKQLKGMLVLRPLRRSLKPFN